MTRAELQYCAAILTAGMIAHDHDSLITAEEAVQMMHEVVEELKRTSGEDVIDGNYSM